MSESEDEKARRLLTGKQKRSLAKRFYKQVDIGGKAAPFSILLDGREIKTPMKARLAVPNRQLAEAVAAEWDGQDTQINPASMPLTRLCNTAVDRVAGHQRQRIIDEIADFANSDLICYRAGSPAGLVERQSAGWDPVLAWMAKSLGARFVSVTGLVHEPQPEPTLRAVRDYLAGCNEFQLAALHNLTTLTGSCVLAIALCRARLEDEDAWALAHIDEDWQIEQWGCDEEAAQRRALYKSEFDATIRFLELVRDE